MLCFVDLTVYPAILHYIIIKCSLKTHYVWDTLVAQEIQWFILGSGFLLHAKKKKKSLKWRNTLCDCTELNGKLFIMKWGTD